MNLLVKNIIIIIIACGFVFAGCARETGSPSGADTNTTDQADSVLVDPLLLSEASVEVPINAVWLNSGIRLHKNERITLIATDNTGDAPMGSPLSNERAPIPTYGSDGLIGRVGEDGFPFAIGGHYDLQGSSLSEGQFLFLGRNIAPPQPFDESVTAATGASTQETLAAEIAPVDYDPENYTVQIEIRQTDAPALLTPINTFFSVDAGGGGLSPVFDWDEIDNASQYVIDVAAFSDFRSIEQSLQIASTSIDTGAFQINPTDPNAPVGFALAEGVWYWRVRAQINDGRLLNPNLMWTDRSVPFVFGVEGLSVLPAPELLTPSGQVSVAEGIVVPFEILVQPDASGLEWRYRFFSASCGDTIDPSDGDIAILASSWLVFQQTFRSNRIEQPEKLYGTFPSPVLTQGSWLVRIETRDGLDASEARLGILDYEFDAGCQ